MGKKKADIVYGRSPQEMAEVIIAEAKQNRSVNLDISNLELTELPPSARKLTRQLVTLDLSFNALRVLPEWIGEFQGLRLLWMMGNPLTAVPESLSKLLQLEQLTLAGSRMRHLPEALGALRNLKLLDLEGLGLETLPNSLLQLGELKVLDVRQNPALGLPDELTGKVGGPKEILDFYFRLHEPLDLFTFKNSPAVIPRWKRVRLREFKMILIGCGEVGKSSLVEVLQGRPFVHGRDPTPGISITQWPLALPDGKAAATVWDFGGQEMMHGTHQFFLTHRTLDLVVVDGRHEHQNEDAETGSRLCAPLAGSRRCWW